MPPFLSESIDRYSRSYSENFFKKHLTNPPVHCIISLLSFRTVEYGGIAQLVEHPVHTRVVICSSQIAATRPVGQVVKTPPFHGGNMGSSPVRVTRSAPAKQERFFVYRLSRFRHPAAIEKYQTGSLSLCPRWDFDCCAAADVTLRGRQGRYVIARARRGRGNLL